MKRFNVSSDYTKKSHHIFDNAIFEDLDELDCDDSINGKCHYGKSIDKCIEICAENKQCNYGYHIKRNNDQDICIPLIDRKDYNPLYRVRDISIYPTLDRIKSTLFINSNKYKYPPTDIDNVLYLDNFIITDNSSGNNLENIIIGSSEQEISSIKDGSLITQLVQYPVNLTRGNKYVPLRYGDEFVLNIPTTNLIAYRENDRLIWKSGLYGISDDIVFTLYPSNSSGKIVGDIVEYKDKFSIIKDDTYEVYINSENKLKIKEIRNRNDNDLFSFIPKMKAYYCKEGNCETIGLDKVKNGLYKGNKAWRQPYCWDQCKKSKSINTYKIITIMSIIIIIIYLYNYLF